MKNYHVDFIARETHVGGIEIELDEARNDGQREDDAIEVIEFAHPDLSDVEITKMTEVA